MTTRRERTPRDEGLVTIWVLGLASITLLLVALVADGARVMAAVSDVGATARAAARAGTLAVDPSSRTLVADLAETEAQTVADAQDMTLTTIVVDPAGTAVTVTVRTTIKLPLLALLGVRTRTLEATATATILEGVQAP